MNCENLSIIDVIVYVLLFFITVFRGPFQCARLNGKVGLMREAIRQRDEAIELWATKYKNVADFLQAIEEGWIEYKGTDPEDPPF